MMIHMFREWFRRHFSDPQIILLVMLLLVVFFGIYLLKDILTPVFAGLFIAYLLDGIAIRLQRFKIPRRLSVLIVFAAFMTAVMVLLFGLLPMVTRQIGQLLQELPSMISRGQQELMHLPEKYPEFFTETQITQSIELIRSQITQLGQFFLSLSLASVRSLITLIVYVVLVPLLVFFFLKDKRMIIDWTKGFLPQNRVLVNEVWQEVDQQFSNYIRGKLWEILIVWGMAYVTFILLKLKFAMLLALLAGLSVMIPYVGVIVVFLPIVVIAFLQWGISSELTYVMVAYSVIQLFDGNLLVHLLQSGSVNLHPVAIVAATLFFGSLWGLWGLFFAVPLATLVHAVIKAWTRTRQEAEHSEIKEKPPRIRA